MVFWSLYAVRSEYGCFIGRDCYILDQNFNELPIKNCTRYDNEDSETKTICYNYNFVLLPALGDTGGALVMTTILMVLTTKLILRLNKKKCYKKHKKCCYCAQVIPLGCAIIGILTYEVCIHLSTFKSAPFRLAGYGLQYAVVLIPLTITILTPWRQVVSEGDISLQNVDPKKSSDKVTDEAKNKAKESTHLIPKSE